MAIFLLIEKEILILFEKDTWVRIHTELNSDYPKRKGDDTNSFIAGFTDNVVTYTLIQTEQGYRVLENRIMILDGMQLRFLYDVERNLVPHLDMISHYFQSLDIFRNLALSGYVQVHPLREPENGEQKVIQVEGVVYYAIYASVFRPRLTQTGKILLAHVKQCELFYDCMEKMDRVLAQNILEKKEIL